MDVCLLWVLCIVRKRSLRRADHSSRGVLPTVVRHYAWSRKPQEWGGHDPRWVAAPQHKKINLMFNVQGSVHRNNILIYIQQEATLHRLFYLETALHVSGGTTTHHQECKQVYLQHLVFVRPLLLPAVIVEELEPVWVCCGYRTPPTAHSNQFQLFHYSGR